MLADADLRERFFALDRDEQIDTLGTALGEAILDEFGPDGLGDLGQGSTDVIAAAAMRYLEPLIPALGAKLQEIAVPAAQKAAEVIEPGVKRALLDYGPTLAIMTGVVAGILVVAGIWFAKRFI